MPVLAPDDRYRPHRWRCSRRWQCGGLRCNGRSGLRRLPRDVAGAQRCGDHSDRQHRNGDPHDREATAGWRARHRHGRARLDESSTAITSPPVTLVPAQPRVARRTCRFHGTRSCNGRASPAGCVRACLHASRFSAHPVHAELARGARLHRVLVAARGDECEHWAARSSANHRIEVRRRCHCHARRALAHPAVEWISLATPPAPRALALAPA